MKVPFLDLRAATAEVRTELAAAISRVVDRSDFILGPEVGAFEQAYASYTGTSDCVTVGNGLDALELAMRALGLPEGAEVIVPANTFIATWLAVTRAGGKIVPVEPIESTYNLDPSRVEAAITDRTCGIVAVHLYGQPADVQALRPVANDRGLWLLEDAAQAHGAMVAGRQVGGWGDAAAWSFYPAKNLGAIGDAGAITTNAPEVARVARLLRNYGSELKYQHETRGMNTRMDEIQAAVLRVKLKHLDNWNARRATIAGRYLTKLATTSLVLPSVPTWANPVWHVFVVRADHRDVLRGSLAEAGVQTLVHYPVPPHLQPAYADYGFPRGAFPLTERIHEEVVSLPMGPHLTDDALDYVVHAIQATLS